VSQKPFCKQQHSCLRSAVLQRLGVAKTQFIWRGCSQMVSEYVQYIRVYEVG